MDVTRKERSEERSKKQRKRYTKEEGKEKFGSEQRKAGKQG